MVGNYEPSWKKVIEGYLLEINFERVPEVGCGEGGAIYVVIPFTGTPRPHSRDAYSCIGKVLIRKHVKEKHVKKGYMLI